MDDGEEDLSTQFLHLTPPEMLQNLDEHWRTTRTCSQPAPAAGDEPKKPREPSGNREAVRKYRDKKKARAAFMAEEVKRLRLANQQLVRRLQGEGALQAEVVRLRSLLADLRGKIDAELGS